MPFVAALVTPNYWPESTNAHRQTNPGKYVASLTEVINACSLTLFFLTNLTTHYRRYTGRPLVVGVQTVETVNWLN